MKNKKPLIAVIWLLYNLWAAFADSEPVELISDPLKLVIYPKTGNFCVYRMDASQASFYAPLYDDRAQGSLNVYSLLFNGHIYHLNNKSGKKIIIEQSRTAITVTFQISLDFIAVQHFSFVKSNGITTGPILKVVTEVQNISGAVADIALKAVFDTSVGESFRVPFYTDIRSEIGSELLLQPAIEKDSLIFSADQGSSAVFFLKGVHQTTPVSVFIANWERLITKTWLPVYVHGRSFKKSAAASDPGILYVWSERKVGNRQFFSISNCIGFYDYRAYHRPAASVVPSVRTSRVYKTPAAPQEKIERAPVQKEQPVEPQAAQRQEQPVEPQTAQWQEQPVEPQAAQPIAEDSEAPQDYADIERLLEQIKKLEESPSDFSQDEIHALQQEVDNAIKTLQEK